MILQAYINTVDTWRGFFFYKNAIFDTRLKHFLSPPVRDKEIAEITPTSVTQGKTWQDNEDCCAAAHAIDNDLSTGAVTQTDNGAAWLKLEFGKIYFIHKVVIYYRFFKYWFNPAGWCVRSEKQKSCGTLQLRYGLEQSDQIYTLLCNSEGDTVKLSKSKGSIAVYEVAVTSTSTVYVCKNFLSTRISKYLVQYSKYLVQYSKYLVQYSKYLVQYSKYLVQYSKYL